MSEIEKTREELEKEWNRLRNFGWETKDNNYYKKADFVKRQLEGFNLGVELGKKEGKEEARKEFLDKIKGLKCYCETCAFEGQRQHEDIFKLINFEELKQQLKTDSLQSTKDEEVKE